MTELLSRVCSLFVAPAATAAGRPVARAVPVPSVALLCRPAAASWTASALALALARDAGAHRAVAALWGTDDGFETALRAPAAPDARRLVAALRAHGLTAEASGRLARVVLPAEPEAAMAGGARAAAIAGAPTVLALAGPREPVLDRLIAAQDLTVVAGGQEDDDALLALAAESVGALGVPVVACRPAAGPRTRALTTAGLAVPRTLGTALAPAVEAAR